MEVIKQDHSITFEDASETVACPDRFLTKICALENNSVVFPSSNGEIYVTGGLMEIEKEFQVRRLRGSGHGCTVQSIIGNIVNDVMNVYSADLSGEIHVGSYKLEDGVVDGENGNCSVIKGPDSESGWTGLCFDGENRVISANFFSKRVSIRDGENEIGSFQTVGHPSNMNLVDENTLAITEDNFVSIWDLRTYTLSHQIVDSNRERLYALSSSTNRIVAGGDSRILTFYDKRNWSAAHHWKNCTKYEVSSCHLNESLCFVSDLYSIIPGSKDTKQSHRDLFKKAVKTDSRLIGTTVQQNTLFSITERGTLSIVSPLF